MDREPSASGFTIVQEGDEPLVVLYCKPYAGSNTVYVLMEALFVWPLVDDKVSSTYLPQNLGGWGST